MPLRHRIRLVNAAFFASVFGLSWFATVQGVPVWSVVISAGICGYLLLPPLYRWLAARSWQALEAADQAQDPAALRRAIDDLTGSKMLPAGKEHLQVAEAEVAILEERFDEAAAVLKSMLQGQTHFSPILLKNNLAWAFALGGRATEAVALAREALAAAEAENHFMLPYCAGTLGVALVQEGNTAEGVELLERALGLGGSPANQAIRQYYLGEAKAGLGDNDAARAAWTAANRYAPTSKWGRLASERLAS